ncbi:MAG: hypothetical protein HXY38_00555 [Chloroflexi bacterium]|nr:hypothetical protein [Chloroflexota bacterium]
MELNFAMTTIPTVLLWGIGLIVFGMGAMLGYFNMNIEARKKLETMENKSQILRNEAEKKLADAERKMEEVLLLKSTLPQEVVEPGILRIKKDKTIEMDGALLTGPLTPEKRKRLIEIVTYLRPWIEGGTSMPATPALATPPAPQRALQTPLAPVSAPMPSQPVKPVSLFGSVPKKADPETEFKLMSMVQQIDTVLQKRIAGTPLEPLGIHLQESPQGGLQVLIGSDKFDGIDDVPNPEVTAAIRAAIAEWEQKYVPGM